MGISGTKYFNGTNAQMIYRGLLRQIVLFQDTHSENKGINFTEEHTFIPIL